MNCFICKNHIVELDYYPYYELLHIPEEWNEGINDTCCIYYESAEKK